MKKISLLLVLLLCLSLVGCSSWSRDAIVVKWDNGVFTINGQTANLDKYTGDSGHYESGDTVYDYAYDQNDDLSLALWNSVGVAEQDMTTFKKSKYFQQFLGTQVTMYYKVANGTYNCANVVTAGTTPIEAMTQEAYNTISKIDFGAIKYVEINNSVRFATADFPIEVRPDAVLITGYIKVSVGSKSECTEPITVGKKTLYYYNSGSYCYYQYGDLVIQTVVGVNLEDYFTFL